MRTDRTLSYGTVLKYDFQAGTPVSAVYEFYFRCFFSGLT